MREKNNMLIAFGGKLKEIRQKKNLSYRKLAQRCDVEYSHIIKIEKGLVSIQMLTLFELAKGLDVHPKELFNFKIDIKNELVK